MCRKFWEPHSLISCVGLLELEKSGRYMPGGVAYSLSVACVGKYRKQASETFGTRGGLERD